MKLHQGFLNGLIKFQKFTPMSYQFRALSVQPWLLVERFTGWFLAMTLETLWCLLKILILFGWWISWCSGEWCCVSRTGHFIRKHGNQQSGRRTLTIEVLSTQDTPIFLFGIPKVTFLVAVNAQRFSEWGPCFSYPLGWKTITISPLAKLNHLNLDVRI